MSAPRRYRLTVEAPEGGLDLAGVIDVLGCFGFRVVTAETDRKPTKAEREAIREAIEGAEAWDTSLTRYLEVAWGMDSRQVAGILVRCVEDRATWAEFVRLAEEWM